VTATGTDSESESRSRAASSCYIMIIAAAVTVTVTWPVTVLVRSGVRVTVTVPSQAAAGRAARRRRRAPRASEMIRSGPVQYSSQSGSGLPATVYVRGYYVTAPGAAAGPGAWPAAGCAGCAWPQARLGFRVQWVQKRK
jgi:hypothetical protein